MSSDPIYFAPMRVPLVDPRTGIITRAWYFLFQQMFERSNISQDLLQDPPSSSADEALAIAVLALQDVTPPLPPPVSLDEPQLLFEQLAQVREQVADLQNQIQAIRQGAVL